MTLTMRRALPADCPAMADLLNEIIRIGGTTAHTDPVDGATIQGWMDRWSGRNRWTLAADETGRVMGFQFIEPHPDLPPSDGDIASFVRVGATGQGIGRLLFEESCKAAKTLGYTALIAVIRADNTNGLAYYAARGFREIDRIKGATLKNGQVVDKIVKRYVLT